ncbi:hypothetical protein HPP92_024395 [Vanilla planifolia]|uniref:CCHC-type domain-containing protein n=1 Tax=Vanilla planifolia TaxID=51239 RepID=A0A835PPP8_VANPL|nr:hypothetical protein HPP92_024395 [Vanilla planifolia]
MNSDKSIKSMFLRFNDITNGLTNLGRAFSNSDLVRKILRILPKEYDPLATAIKAAKDINKLSLDELLGELLTAEIEMIRKLMEEASTSKLKHERKKEEPLAFKATKCDLDSTSTSSTDLEDEVSSHVKGLAKNLAKNFLNRKWKKKSNKERKRPPTCFGCDRTDHIKTECPKLKDKHMKEEKKNKSLNKKKVFQATWSASEDSDVSSSSRIRVCFMANEASSISSSEEEENEISS